MSKRCWCENNQFYFVTKFPEKKECLDYMGLCSEMSVQDASGGFEVNIRLGPDWGRVEKNKIN